MVFKARYTLSGNENNPPVRAYLHISGIKVFGEFPIDGAREHLESILENHTAGFDLKDFDYLIVTLWGDLSMNKRADFFCYSDLKENWKGNPDIKIWPNVNGIRIVDPVITCGETIRVLDCESRLRENSKNLNDYFYTSKGSPRKVKGLDKIAPEVDVYTFGSDWYVDPF